MARERARFLLPDADLRSPIRRGDLDAFPAGTVVGIVDGVLAHTLAISPGEIREAVRRGVTIYGAASMGALRAAEIPAMTGIGRIYEMFRSGALERDDEVAVLVDPRDDRALTVALVNVRFAVERLVRSGTINKADGDALVRTAAALHYSDRTYSRILAESPLARNQDATDLIALLRGFDLKREDAHLLLETLGRIAAGPVAAPSSETPRAVHARARIREPADSAGFVWESGDAIGFGDLLAFLKWTGRFDRVAREAVAGRAPKSGDAPAEAQRLLDAGRAAWGWETPEEAHVTLRDLGLGINDLADLLEHEACRRRAVEAAALTPDDAFLRTFRGRLWLHDLDLKREILRLGALRYFARAAVAPPDTEEIDAARRTIARLRHSFRWRNVVDDLGRLGLDAPAVDAAVDLVARARRSAGPIAALAERPPCRLTPRQLPDAGRHEGLAIVGSPKAEGSRRFSLAEAEASETAEAIARRLNVARIGLVGELDTVGIHIAQVFAERATGGWSSSFSSGKAETREGARIGGIMEEVEIRAQDAYAPERLTACFADLRQPAVDPRELGLPFDSCYRPNLPIEWSSAFDLVGDEVVLVPTAMLVADRLRNDVLYSPRLGGKMFSTSGLGSGFTLAEAIVHAAAEYVERHACRMAEVQIDNPGGVGTRRFRFIDLETLPETPARIAARYAAAGIVVRILDITCEVRIPTFCARVFEDPFTREASTSSDGFASHPDPMVAITMALLEAAQTRGGYIAGGREDYSLQARSLGRHERPRTAVPRFQSFWFGSDPPVRPFDAASGLRTCDIADELAWMIAAVVDAGCPRFLVADYGVDAIRPAFAVRVLIPGLETTNPLATGARARAAIIADLLPRGRFAP